MNLSRLFDTLLLRNKRDAAQRRRVLKSFSEKMGWVYFGFVDQHSDEHKVVRGFTLSPTHRDNSYIVGEYDDRPIALVDRFDVIANGQTVEKHSWLILETSIDPSIVLPHVFLLPTHQKSVHYNKIFTAFRSLEKVDVEANVPDFHSRYEIYSRPDQHDRIEELLPIEVIRVIAAHFWPVAIELSGNNLFFYYADKKLTENALDSIIKNSVWLGQTLETSTDTD